MSVRFTVPTAAPGDALFDDMPAEVREILESGFSQLVTLPPEALQTIASQAIKWLDPTEPAPEVDTLAREVEVECASHECNYDRRYTPGVSTLFRKTSNALVRYQSDQRRGSEERGRSCRAGFR